MSLRTKAFLATATVVVLGTAALFAVLTVLSAQGFDSVERDLVARDVRRTLGVLATSEKALVATATDYAAWDETYFFIENLGAAGSTYVEDNFVDSTFTANDVQAIGIATVEGEFLYAATHSPDTGTEQRLPLALATVAFGAARELRAGAAPQVERGILRDGSVPWMVAVVPTTRTDGTGPANGVVIMARVLDEARLAALGEPLGYPLRITPLDRLQATPEVRGRLAAPPPAVAVDLASGAGAGAESSQAAGYATLAQLNADTPLVVHFDEARTVLAQAERQNLNTLIALVALGAGLVAVVLYLLHRLVLSRLLAFGATVRRIADEGTLDARIEVKGNDELARLATDVNEMLDRIETVTSQLEHAREVAEAASTSKSEFLANMSHELRTPMNAILGLTRLAKDAASDADRLDMLETVESSAESLLAIVGDILDLSKVESGKLTLSLAPFSVAETVDEVLALMEPVALRQGISLVSERGDVPAALVGDAQRLRQVLLNLVGNAVKFTQEGGVTVRLDATPERTDRVLLAVDVSDTGIGIPEDRIKHVFDAFAQADTSTTRNYGGTGLGLTISNRLVQLMGGDLSVSSTVGEGSTFSIRLPLPIAQSLPAPGPGAAPAPEADTGPPPQRSLHVLVAEDNLVNQKVVARTLERLGHTCTIVDDGSGAVEAAAAGGVDVVLMDLQMPIMDGLEATRRIRATEAATGAHVPIVALTAHAMTGDRERCLEAGMDAYTSKPYTVEMLQSSMREAAARAAASCAPVAATPAADA